jgi:hypothetical protein
MTRLSRRRGRPCGSRSLHRRARTPAHGGSAGRNHHGQRLGSRDDAPRVATTLAELGVPHEMRVVSAHRTPDLLFEYAAGAASRGLRVIIAGRRRRGPFARNDGFEDAPSGHRRPRSEQTVERSRLSAFDRADAPWRAGCDDGDRKRDSTRRSSRLASWRSMILPCCVACRSASRRSGGERRSDDRMSEPVVERSACSAAASSAEC